jgi:sugar lactone lactonase YvrE
LKFSDWNCMTDLDVTITQSFLVMKSMTREVKFSHRIISSFKKVPFFVGVSFFLFSLWSACKESEDPTPAGPDAPAITSFSPTSGTSGTVVTITGSNFSSAPANNVVKFNNTLATLTAAAATSLTVEVPVGATTGKVTVEVDGQVATSSTEFIITQPPTVTLTNFSPATGAAGTLVTLTGTNFSATAASNTVKFNGEISPVSAATNTSLTVTVPEDAGTGKITVQVGNQIATSASDFIFIANKNSVVTLAGNGALGFADGDGATARFYQPTGVALDPAGNIYVADSENHRIRKIAPGGTVSTLAGSGTAGSADGVGALAQFNSPRAVAVDATGNIFVADGLNHMIRKIAPDGTVTTFAGSGDFGFADGAGTNARFYFPKGIALDASGNIYVADDINSRIRKITPAGTVTTLAGSTPGSTDGIGTAAQFRSPRGVTVDATGNVYVADAGNHRIRMITPDGTVSTIAGNGVGVTDGEIAVAKFNTPAGIVLDPAGTIYVADDENERIRKITPAGVVSTLAGGFLPGFTDGVGGNAQFNSPTALAIDGTGNIYVADRHNHSVRKIQ